MKKTRVISKLGIIGYGNWGCNLVRIFNTVPACSIKYICDIRKDRLSLAKSMYPEAKLTRHVEDILLDRAIDGVVIATPSSTHYDIADKSLYAGKNVYVEKPFTTSLQQSLALFDLSWGKKLILFAGHTFIYSRGIQQLKILIHSELNNRIKRIKSIRYNTYYPSESAGILWDLAYHDIYIFNFLLNSEPSAVSCVNSKGRKLAASEAVLELIYPNNIQCEIHVSYSGVSKRRETTVTGENGLLNYSGVYPDDEIILYKNGSASRMDVIKEEPLWAICFEYCQCIQNKRVSTITKKEILDVARVIEAGYQSLANEGSTILVEL